MGIGTTVPHASLEIKNDAGVSISGSNYDDAYRLRRDGPTGYLDLVGNQSVFSGYRLFVNGTTEAVRISNSGNVGIGTPAPQYKLTVNGTLGAKEVIVTNTGWADYVFKPDYRPRPLNDLAAFIRERHHLPDIPSEAEIQTNGVNLGEMQVKLLAKIEELTLHMIQANERNDRLEQETLKLQTQNQSNQARIARLEALFERQITNPGRKPE